MLFYDEIIKSVRNVFKSNFTTKFISQRTKISYTTISELRNEKRDIFNTNVEVCYALYNFSVENGLNQKMLDFEKRKGRYDAIDLKLQVEKVLVSFDGLDLFGLGIMNISNYDDAFERNKLVRLILSNSVFLVENKKCYDTYEFGWKFNCNYVGAGPNSFARFVAEHSKINRDKIEETIYSNNIVMYNLKQDEINGVNSNINWKGINLNKYNSKLIITLDKYHNDIFSPNDIIEDIENITKILCESYNNIELEKLIYVCDFDSDDTKKYIGAQNEILHANSYRIIFEYKDFEIWIPCYISNDDFFNKPEIKGFLDKLGIQEKEKGFLDHLWPSNKNEHMINIYTK